MIRDLTVFLLQYMFVYLDNTFAGINYIIVSITEALNFDSNALAMDESQIKCEDHSVKANSLRFTEETAQI